jgi:hypothetical protein
MMKFSTDAELNAAEQDFFNVFSHLSEREAIKVFEDSIRDAKNDSERQTLRFLLSEFKESCKEIHG